jgi:hypothetical protein
MDLEDELLKTHEKLSVMLAPQILNVSRFPTNNWTVYFLAFLFFKQFSYASLFFLTAVFILSFHQGVSLCFLFYFCHMFL